MCARMYAYPSVRPQASAPSLPGGGVLSHSNSSRAWQEMAGPAPLVHLTWKKRCWWRQRRVVVMEWDSNGSQVRVHVGLSYVRLPAHRGVLIHSSRAWQGGR